MKFSFVQGCLFLIGGVLGSDLNRDESFHEELLLKPLPTGDLLAHFRFTTLLEGGDNVKNFHLFPRHIGELKDVYGLNELDLSLSRGVWRDSFWGYSPSSAPPGAKVAAWFDSTKVSDVDSAWHHVTNALAGIVCASLNFLDSQTTVSPQYSFQPSGVFQNKLSNVSHFRVGYLPGENVCTENLTPWKKLLPCESKRGLATLLNAGPIHRSKFHSIGLTFRNICPEGKELCSNKYVELVQSVTLVLTPEMWPENQDKTTISWSIRSLFGIGLSSTCPLATSSRIFLDNSAGHLSLDKEIHHDILGTDKGTSMLSFDLERLIGEGHNNIIVRYPKIASRYIFTKPGLHATRFLSGFGQERGEVVTKITNNLKSSLKIVFFDVLPWYMRVFFHTLTIKQDGRVIQPLKSHFIPGVDRQRPYSIELVIQLSPKSVTTISVSYEKSILKWLEYPPDANHGFYVGPATIAAILPNRNNFTAVSQDASTLYETISNSPQNKDTFLRIFTEILLLDLPTPDFSMPYNVICLSCTAVALAFGPLHNITTKTLVLEKEGEKKRLVSKIMEKIMFWRNKKKENEEQEKEDEKLVEEKTE